MFSTRYLKTYHMKPYTLLCLAAAMLAACAGPSTEQKADSTAVQPAGIHANPGYISTYAGNIDEQSGSNYRMLALHDYKRGDHSIGVMGLFRDSAHAVRLYLYPEGKQPGPQTETWLYLDSANGRAVLLREIVTQDGKVTEHSFYYNNDSVLQAETRAATDLTLLEDAAFAPFQSPAPTLDFRLRPAAVDSLAQKVIRAVLEDRQDLSPAANAWRKEGASYYGVGNEPGWNVAVIPNRKIVLKTNYGKDEYQFPYGDPLKNEREATQFSSEANGHTFSVKFEQRSCTDDAGNKHPMTVTVLLDGKKFSGCGLSLY